MKKQILCILLLSLICSLVLVSTIQFSRADAGTKVHGIIFADTTWQKSSSPYNLTGALSVNTGVTLTIEPGVIVYLNNNYLQVNGTLTARGTATEPINFINGIIQFTNNTASWDETAQSGSIIENAFVNCTAPNGQDYSQKTSAINITKSAPKISNVIINSYDSIVNCINVDSGAPIISNCSITPQNGYGIRVRQGNITIVNNTFYSVDSAVFVDNCFNASISGNRFNGKSGCGDGIAVLNSNASVCNNFVYGFIYDGIAAASNFEDNFWDNIRSQATITVENNLVVDNKNGVQISLSGSGATTRSATIIQNNTIIGNDVGLKILGVNNKTVIKLNNVLNCTKYDVELSTSYNVNVSNNWWGTTDTHTINQAIYDYQSDFNLGNTTFVPFQTLPNMHAPTCTEASAGYGGSISINGISKLHYGDNQTFIMTANRGYHLSDVLVNGSSVGAKSPCTLENITGASTVYATFELNQKTPLPTLMQFVVDSLESKGFDVTFVYFGSNKTLTYNTEDTAVVVMKTTEHVKNFNFTINQERQFREGNCTLHEAYPNAEVFIVFIFEDLNNDGVPDEYPQATGYYEVSGGGFGGRTSTAFPNDYWNQADQYVLVNTITPTPTSTPSPSPTPTPTPAPTATPTPTPSPSATPTVNPTTNPTAAPTTNLTTQPTQNPTGTPTVAPTQNVVLPTPTPSIPEYPAILLLPLFALVLFGVVAFIIRKQANKNVS